MENKQAISLEEEKSQPLDLEETANLESESNVFFKMIDRLNQGLAILAGLALVCMMLLVVFNAVKRLYSDPIAGTVELVSWLGAITAVFSLGYAQLHRGHVYIDLLVNKLPNRSQKIIHSFMNVLSMGFFLIAAWQIVSYGLDLMNSGVVSETIQVAFYPLVILCSVGFFSLVMAILKETILIWREVA